MKFKDLAIRAALLSAVFAGPIYSRISAAQPAQDLHYQASCTVIESESLDGYVANLSPDTYLVQGMVRFRFYSADSMSRPELLVPTDSLIPPGKIVRVVRAQLTFELRPGETCRFTVNNAIRKQSS